MRNNPDIDFLYLRGNHDNQESYDEELDNLKTFSPEWTSYSYGDVVFSGIETVAENYSSMYSTINLNPEKTNIVILHGQKSESVGDGKINILKLKNKNIDYLALGHIHSASSGKIDERGFTLIRGVSKVAGSMKRALKGLFSPRRKTGKFPLSLLKIL